MSDFASLLTGAIAFSAPLILAAIGGLYSERSGVINIALEGKMLSAACASALIAAASGNAILGLLAGIIAATVMSLGHYVLTQIYRLDHIISGMGLNAIALGATGLTAKSLKSIADQEMPILPLPVYYIAAIVAVTATWFMLTNTTPGLRLLAVGSDPEKSRQAGLKPKTIRWQALLMTGLLCGLAGTLIASNAGRFSSEMTAGRGYIALAALILGGWRPWPTLAAAAAFGFFSSLQLMLQGTASAIPSEFWQSLPYLVALLAIALLPGKKLEPQGLGRP
jgi:simple sugar transport system permease protein